MPKSTTVLATAAMFFATLVAAADDVPRIDFEKICRSRVQAVGQVGDRTLEQSFASCVNAEKEAQTALIAAWKDIPARYKTECIKPNVYSPSYSEWIACLELLIDVKAVRSKSNN